MDRTGGEYSYLRRMWAEAWKTKHAQGTVLCGRAWEKWGELSRQEPYYRRLWMPSQAIWTLFCKTGEPRMVFWAGEWPNSCALGGSLRNGWCNALRGKPRVKLASKLGDCNNSLGKRSRRWSVLWRWGKHSSGGQEVDWKVQPTIATCHAAGVTHWVHGCLYSERLTNFLHRMQGTLEQRHPATSRGAAEVQQHLRSLLFHFCKPFQLPALPCAALGQEVLRAWAQSASYFWVTCTSLPAPPQDPDCQGFRFQYHLHFSLW